MKKAKQRVKKLTTNQKKIETLKPLIKELCSISRKLHKKGLVCASDYLEDAILDIEELKLSYELDDDEIED